MKILESVRLAMQIFPNSFINHNNEIILNGDCFNGDFKKMGYAKQ